MSLTGDAKNVISQASILTFIEKIPDDGIHPNILHIWQVAVWVWQCNTADQLMETTIYSNTTVTDTVKVMHIHYPPSRH